MALAPSRGEVWWGDLNPPTGHEQAGRRPVLVISADAFNRGPAGMVAIAPITSRDKGIPLHVRVDPPEGGLDVPSFVMCDQLRTISTDRLDARRGATGRLSPGLMAEVEDRVRVFFDL